MNAEQKRAWLGVTTMAACVVGYLALVPFYGPWVATAAFGLYGLNGFSAFFGLRQRMDERDRAISLRATMIGALVSYLAFVAGCMGAWAVVFALHRQQQVSVHILSAVTMWGAIAFLFTRSLVILVLYGRHVEADNA